ncbi:unnamed protein product [Parnassius mnemosyne]|uniref:Uncharacterized protein n=1 Tax=Parnassius mnemosyne TaxID=213953 RepID=A0AAV1LSF0_9NEOP
MECLASPSTSGKTRKRTAHPENWKQNIAKRQRYSPKESPNRPRCQHLRKGVYKCESITMRDVMNFHAAFYKYHNKETQDAFLLKYCVPVIPKRKRPKNKKHHPKTIHTNYSIYSILQKKKITICQKAFLGILNITKHRVQYIAKKFVESGGQAVK